MLTYFVLKQLGIIWVAGKKCLHLGQICVLYEGGGGGGGG